MLPVVQPGYSVKLLKEKTLKAYEFEILHQAMAPEDRTTFAPKIIPTELRIGGITSFVDVYEPVGVSVEEQGIILTQQARMEIATN